MARLSPKSRTHSLRKHRRTRWLKIEPLEERRVLATVLGTGTGALLGGDLTDPENNGDPNNNIGYNAIFSSNDEPYFGGSPNPAGGNFASEGSFDVFDNQVGGGNAKWCCNAATPANPKWVQADFGADNKYLMTHFTITSSNDSPGRDPLNWKILGSNDGTNFTTIFTSNGTNFWSGGVRNQVILFQAGVDFPVPTETFSIFRYEATSVVSGTAHALNELEFFGFQPTKPDSYMVDEDQVLNVPAPGVLANDSNPYGPLAVATGSVTAPAQGTLTITETGALTYNQNGAFNSLNAGETAQVQVSYGVINFLGTSLPVVVAPTGPNGELHAYAYDARNVSFDQARFNASQIVLNGSRGHLATISSAAENAVVQAIALGDAWIGFTDLDSVSSLDNFNYASLGTSEFGNTSGQAYPPGGNRGAGYRWVTGEPVTYQNWGGGEPNDAGGEDAGQIRGDGFWNDLPAGSTAGQNAADRRAIIEFDVVPDNLGGFVVTSYRAQLQVNNLQAVDNVLNANNPGLILGTGTFALMDFSDDGGGGSGGDFGTNNVPPGLADGVANDDVFIRTTGTFTVPAGGGTYVFTIGGDDGGRLIIDGTPVITDNGLHGHTNFSTGNLALSAGSHTFDWVQFERGGGYGAELSYDNINVAGGRVLFGDTSQGLTFGTMTTTTWQGRSPQINSLATAEALIQNGPLLNPPISTVAGVVNINVDSGNAGNISGDFSMPGLPAGADDAVIEATGNVYIPAAGDYTFAVARDDGFSLTIDGATITSGTGFDGDSNFASGKLAGGCCGTTFGVYNFPAAGFYPLRLVVWERAGGFYAELAAAPGSHTTFNPSFDLVGDVLNGGLGVVPTVPATSAITDTVTITIVGQNDAPTVSAGGPYSISEGQDLTLSATGSDVDVGQTATLTYAWDLDNDGQFDDATGANPTVAWSTLNTLGFDGLNPAAANTIRVQVTDAGGMSGVGMGTVNVANTAPTLTFNAPPAGAPGIPISFDFTAFDPSDVDSSAGLTLSIDWGDGDSDTVNNASAGSIDHSYSLEDTYTITVTLTDKDGGVDEQTFDILISPVFLDADGNLIVNGGGGSDRIILAEGVGGVNVRINGRLRVVAPETNTVMVFGGSGNDTITVSGRSVLNYILHGEAGNDYLAGGLESDIIDGGDGNDRLFGNNGDDFLLGGAGNDRGNGGNGNDIIYGDGYLDEAGDIDLQEVYETAYMDYDSAFYQFSLPYFIFNDADGRDNLYGDRGDDVIFGGSSNDRLYGGSENDRLYGEDGNDFVDGSNGDDLLVGGEGTDALYGRNGNDVLIGGDGGDRLYGGSGDDLMVGDGVDEFELQELWMTWSQLGIGAADDLVLSIEDDNNAVDQLYGQTGLDWFVVFGRDSARDPRSGDRVDRDAF